VLTLALIRLSNSYADQPNLVLTGAALAILPPVLIFIFAQRYFIEGGQRRCKGVEISFSPHKSQEAAHLLSGLLLFQARLIEHVEDIFQK
jgi:hypothetical protein